MVEDSETGFLSVSERCKTASTPHQTRTYVTTSLQAEERCSHRSPNDSTILAAPQITRTWRKNMPCVLPHHHTTAHGMRLERCTAAAIRRTWPSNYLPHASYKIARAREPVIPFMIRALRAGKAPQSSLETGPPVCYPASAAMVWASRAPCSAEARSALSERVRCHRSLHVTCVCVCTICGIVFGP